MTLCEWNDYVDRIEAQLAKGEIEDFDTKHRFADGMYIREIFMPAGTIVVSNIHKTTHPFTIMLGEVQVRTQHGISYLAAPYFGITTPDTRRILFMQKDTRWITYHATPLKDVEEIMDSILVKRTNPLLTPAQLLKIKHKVKTTNLLNI
jgi:hypothetical protein